MENPFFGYYLLGVCQGLLADGHLSSAKILFFRDFILTEHAVNKAAFEADKYLRCFYNLFKDLPDDEAELTNEIHDAMVSLCLALLAREGTHECDLASPGVMEYERDSQQNVKKFITRKHSENEYYVVVG